MIPPSCIPASSWLPHRLSQNRPYVQTPHKYIRPLKQSRQTKHIRPSALRQSAVSLFFIHRLFIFLSMLPLFQICSFLSATLSAFQNRSLLSAALSAFQNRSLLSAALSLFRLYPVKYHRHGKNIPVKGCTHDGFHFFRQRTRNG